LSTVTYKNQPAIHNTRGDVPILGTSHVYTVNKLLWYSEVEEFVESKLIGYSLHVCCGKSKIGNVRLDKFEKDVTIIGDADRLPFSDNSFDTVLIDPPYNGKFQWNHDMLNELHRVARQRIIFQHWFSPIDKFGRFKKCHQFELTEIVNVPIPDKEFELTELYNWNPRTYFGRMQIISILDRVGE
jgi:hypothetical protein